MDLVEFSQPASQAVRRMLHINNPPPLLRMVEKFCQAKKISVDSMESGSAAFHHALVKQYQLILVGVPVPGIDIFRLVRGLERAGTGTPILVMTDPRMKDKLDFSRFPNVIGLIPKPLELAELSKYLEFLNKPIQVEPQEKERLLAILRKWEIRMSDAA